MYYLTNLTYFTPHKRFEDRSLLINRRQIQRLGSTHDSQYPPKAQVIDCQGFYVTPGFIDLQLNGAFGFDFTADPNSLWSVATKLPRYGLSGFLPTIITSPLETVKQAQEVLANPPEAQQGAIPLGLHLEGPFLHPDKKGAHNPNYLCTPNLALIRDWAPQQGISLVTLAPELAGSSALISTLVQRGVVVSAGHSMATFEQARAGIADGIRYGTHLFNAMPSVQHREPGLITALLTDRRLTLGLIVDGQHLHPAMVQLVWQAVGPTQLTLVTDAMAALGMPAGAYQLGDFDVIVDEHIARLPSGTLAGSILSPDQALKNLISFTGCTLSDALPTLTSVPAKLLGLGQRKGHIGLGYDADLTFLTPDLTVAATMVGGEFVYLDEDKGHQFGSQIIGD